MVGRALLNAAWLALMGVGSALLGYAVVVAAGRVPPPRGRAWGAAAYLSRWRFALYFGALGLFWSLTMYLALTERDNRLFFALVAGPALATLALSGGWLVMARRGGGA
jgi:hypothetical protein